MGRPGSAEHIIRGLYEAAATLAEDMPLFDALSQWMNVEHVVLFQNGPGGPVRTSCHLADLTSAEQMLGIAEMTRLPDIFPLEATFVRHTDYCDRSQLRGERIYQEILHRYDGGLAACAYWRGNGTFNAMLFCRSLRRGSDFVDSELAALQTLLPHVAAIQSIRHNLQRANQIALASGLALNDLDQALFLIDATGHLAFRNDLANELLADGDSFVLTSRGLACRSGASSSRLAAAITAIHRWPHRLSHAPAAETIDAFMLKRPGRSALSVSVLPVRGLSILSGAGLEHGWVSILVTDTEALVRQALSRLASRYGLTARETQLVTALVAGHTLPSAAMTLGVTHETARQYLKVIFSKTGVHRQAELVRLASRLAG